MNEPTMDANIAAVAIKLKEGKTAGQICCELDITRVTLWKYLKVHLQDYLGQLTQDAMQTYQKVELQRCDELERRTEEGAIPEAKRISLLLQIMDRRHSLLGLIPKEPAIQINNEPQLAPANISFTIVPRKQIEVISPRAALPQLPAAPEPLAVVEREIEPQIIPPVSEPGTSPVRLIDPDIDPVTGWNYYPRGRGYPKLFPPVAPAVESFRARQVRLQEEENGGVLILRGGPKRAEGLEDLG